MRQKVLILTFGLIILFNFSFTGYNFLKERIVQYKKEGYFLALQEMVKTVMKEGQVSISVQENGKSKNLVLIMKK